MYIGHYGAAELLHKLDPSVPILPILIGVAYPDLLWPLLVYAGKEKVRIDPKSPLQKTIKFISYPYSHSLVRSAMLTLLPSVVIGVIYHKPMVGIFFFAAAVSHWLLDVLMHVHDLPVLGYGRDRKVGFGLWRFPRIAFATEYLFFAGCTLAFVAPERWVYFLLAGLVLHLFNANSFLGFTKANPTKTANRYAGLALLGFAVATVVFFRGFTY